LLYTKIAVIYSGIRSQASEQKIKGETSSSNIPASSRRSSAHQETAQKPEGKTETSIYSPKPHESSIDPEKKVIIEKYMLTTGQAIEASGIPGRRRGKLTQASN